MSNNRKLNVLNISILKEIWLKSIKTEYFVDTKFSKQLVKKTIEKILFLSGRRHYKSDEHNNRKIRHQRPRNHSFINDLKTTEFSEKFRFIRGFRKKL